MKPEEAIFWVKDTKYIYENMNPDMQLSRLKCEAFVLSIQALEKQVAKKPIGISLTHDGRVANCPNCNEFITEFIDKRQSVNGCYKCLQRLDWGEDHE